MNPLLLSYLDLVIIRQEKEKDLRNSLMDEVCIDHIWKDEAAQSDDGKKCRICLDNHIKNLMYENTMTDTEMLLHFLTNKKASLPEGVHEEDLSKPINDMKIQQKIMLGEAF